jgi:hypothetical protein
VVRVEVNAELAEQRLAMVHHMDSLWGAMSDTLIVRAERQAAASVDSMASRVALATTDPGRITYSPRITVQSDTAHLARIEDRFNALDDIMGDVLRQLAVLSTRHTDEPPTRRELRKAAPKQTWER